MSLNVFNIGVQCNLRFLSTTVLQGSVATRVNYGKIFNDLVIANLLLSVMVKEFWRSVRIRQSYSKKSSGTFFSGHGVNTFIRHKKQTKEIWKKNKKTEILSTRTDRERFKHAPNTHHRKSYSHVYKLNSCLSSHTGTVYTQRVHRENVWTLSHDYNIQ